MWNIKDIKKNARQNIKKNLWTLLFIGFLMSFIFNEYVISRQANENSDIINNFITEYEENGKIELSTEAEDGTKKLNENIDRALSKMFLDTEDGSVRDINEEYGITHGVFYGVFSFYTREKLQIRNIFNSISDYTQKLRFAQLLLVFYSVLGLFLKIFLINPIIVGEHRIFLESRNYRRTKIRRITYVFSKQRYLSTVKAIFKKNLYKALWDITVIGGIIKNYSYLMVPFIVAENPKISGRDAIDLSRAMMNGNKMKAFKLDLSFIPWHILQLLTLGLAGIWVNTYLRASYSELYVTLRNEYIKEKKADFKLLNDYKLYEENDLTKYPDEDTKKRRINYSNNYRPSSIILFFFTFAFAGWLWEVLLYLFRDGILVNRGTSYGPWLPIYGFSCTAIILLTTRFKLFRKLAKYPFLMFIFIMAFATICEYATSWALEVTTGLKYWDYSGVFLNINGRVCFECSLFFGFGGSLCLYIIAPFLEKKFEHFTLKVRIIACMILVSLFALDELYSFKHPHQGEGITQGANFESQIIEE